MSQNHVRHNIIIFGESGSGKSSVVNMLVGEKVAPVSSSPFGCTFKTDFYDVTIGDTSFRIYDTAGLNETEQGRVPHWQAVANLYTLIRKLDGVSLLIYCMRGRFKENARANWEIFNNIVCGGNVPTIAVFTGVEQDDDLGDPKKTQEMMAAFDRLKMTPKGISFVTPIRGRHDEFGQLFEGSQTQLRDFIRQSRREQPWSTEKDDWFASIYHSVHTTTFCGFFTMTKVVFSAKIHVLMDEFAEETGMQQEDFDALQDTLLKAEKKFMKKKRWGFWNYYESLESFRGHRRGSFLEFQR